MECANHPVVAIRLNRHGIALSVTDVATGRPGEMTTDAIFDEEMPTGTHPRRLDMSSAAEYSAIRPNPFDCQARELIRVLHHP